nr:MAG TPA: hypothetical protein [Caudoviricetes sp.]
MQLLFAKVTAVFPDYFSAPAVTVMVFGDTGNGSRSFSA